jgi:hypothetical protein
MRVARIARPRVERGGDGELIGPRAEVGDARRRSLRDNRRVFIGGVDPERGLARHSRGGGEDGG